MKPLLQTPQQSTTDRPKAEIATQEQRWLPVVHLSSLQQTESFCDHRVEDLVADGELRLKPLEQQATVSTLAALLGVCRDVCHLVRAELLSEAGVRRGDVDSETVLHPLQERHPALALLLETLPPQLLRLQLAANPHRCGLFPL